MDKSEIIDMLLRAKVCHLEPRTPLILVLMMDQKTASGGNVPPPPSVSEIPDGSSVGMAEPLAIPAPVYHFLDYNVSRARSVNDMPTAGTNAGLGVSMPAPEPAPANAATQNWNANNNWVDNNTAAPQQPTTTNAWEAPQPAAAQYPPQSQPQQAQQAQQPTISPIQFDSNVQTYRPNAPAPAPAPCVTGEMAPGRPVGGRPATPPNGGWNAAQTVAGSNASDNGMAGWGQSVAGGGSVSGGGGGGPNGGWGGSVAGSAGGAAAPAPTGGW